MHCSGIGAQCEKLILQQFSATKILIIQHFYMRCNIFTIGEFICSSAVVTLMAGPMVHVMSSVASELASSSHDGLSWMVSNNPLLLILNGKLSDMYESLVIVLSCDTTLSCVSVLSLR